MNKKFLSVFIVLFIGMVSAETIEFNYNPDYSGIQITQLKYEPFPVNPGEYIDLWVKVNLGTSARDATIELIPQFPFSLDPNEEAVRRFGSTATEIIVKYKVRVSKDAVEGVNTLHLMYSPDGSKDRGVIKTFDIDVANVQTDFDLIVQESSGTDISLAIANIGKNVANSLIVRIPQQDNYKASGTSGQMVGNLDSGDYTIISFSVMPTGRTNEKLKVQFDYTDAIGERRSVVKEVEVVQSSSGLNATRQMPSGATFQRSTTQQQSSSLYKSYWFWIVVIVLAAGVYFLIRYSKEVKLFFSKRGREKKDSVPEWVAAERKKRR